MKNLISKIGIIILAIVTLITYFTEYKIVKAKEDNTIYAKSTYGNLLKYNGQEITTTFVVYNKNGTEYPAYRTSPKEEGIKTSEKYELVIDKKIDDAELWKVVVNGYPYKAYKTLGCNNEQEAYTATEEAIFCEKYGRSIDDYETIGAAGTRVKNAMTKILKNAKTTEKYSDELEVSSEEGKFVLDSIDKNYMSQTFNISIKYGKTDLKLTLEGDYPEGTKITDLNNNEIKQYLGSTAFKVIYPVKNANKSGSFNVKVVVTAYSSPVRYGKVYDVTPKSRSAVIDSEIQQYILTDSILGDSETIKTLDYDENEAKITIIKLDKSTNKPLEGVKFSLLNLDEKPVYTDLITNNRGEITINHVLPGRYYLQEISTLEGYIKYDKLIAVPVQTNQAVTITVKNSKENNQEYSEDNSNITVEKGESNTNININNENTNINEQNTNTNVNITNENMNTNKQDINTNTNINNKNENINIQNINQNSNVIKLPKTGM